MVTKVLRQPWTRELEKYIIAIDPGHQTTCIPVSKASFKFLIVNYEMWTFTCSSKRMLNL